ncbi:fdxN element excision controlling factor protein [Calothrix sp. NIES-4071]|nr:fdxN element excision controlling factor protein [Calothrix sp. NIES-4071]BAZ54583.1 fdxN element excision controlling factor protein [Calothrix sp. NIES-4105]
MARDVFHYAVRNGLEKEGWLITDDPLRIKAGGADMEIDLGAEKLIAAERGDEKIALLLSKVLSVRPIFQNFILRWDNLLIIELP